MNDAILDNPMTDTDSPTRNTVSDTTPTIYTKDNCMQCNLTKAYFQRNSIQYVEYNMDHDTQARQRVVDMGYSAAPVVVSGFDHWSGLQPDKLKTIPR